MLACTDCHSTHPSHDRCGCAPAHPQERCGWKAHARYAIIGVPLSELHAQVGWEPGPTLAMLAWEAQGLLYASGLERRLARPAATLPVFANQVHPGRQGAGRSQCRRWCCVWQHLRRQPVQGGCVAEAEQFTRIMGCSQKHAPMGLAIFC